MRRPLALALLGLAVVAPAAAAAQSASAATVVRIPNSIDASGGTDVTDALNRAFASLPDGATVEFPTRARYRVEGVLLLVGLHDITLHGNGSELIAQTDGRDVAPPPGRYKARWPRLRDHVTVQDVTGLTLDNLSIRGPNSGGAFVAALEGQAGVAVYKSSHVVLQHLSVARTYGDGVYVAAKSDDVAVRDSSFDTIGRQGVAVVDATNVVIERNHLQKVARSVFDLEPGLPRSSVEGVHIRDNEVGGYTNFLLAAGGAGPNVSDVWLERNRVTGGNGIAVFAGQKRWLRHGLHILDNQSDVDGREVSGTSRTGVMQIARIDGIEIRGNRQRVAAGTIAVTLLDSCNVTVRDNTFPGAGSELRQTGSCADGPRAGSGGGNSQSAGARDGGVKAAKGRKGSTSRDWMIAGGLGGVAVLLVLGRQALRKRARSRA